MIYKPRHLSHHLEFETKQSNQFKSFLLHEYKQTGIEISQLFMGIVFQTLITNKIAFTNAKKLFSFPESYNGVLLPPDTVHVNPCHAE